MHRNDFYNRVEEAFVRVLLQQVTDHLYGRGRRPNFVEVGANDGISSSKTFEFIQHHEWRGVSVEPVPAVFERLRANLEPYPRVAALHAAVSNREGMLPFYQVNGSGTSGDDVWLPMLSSFDRDVILRQRVTWPEIEARIEEVSVPTLTLDRIVEDHLDGRLDILLTDAEGHDDVIVRSLDLRVHRPLVIHVEHIHLAPARLRDLDTRLTRHGYHRCILWMDTMWFSDELLVDECVQRMLRTMPVFMPDHDATFGNGYWLNA